MAAPSEHPWTRHTDRGRSHNRQRACLPCRLRARVPLNETGPRWRAAATHHRYYPPAANNGY